MTPSSRNQPEDGKKALPGQSPDHRFEERKRGNQPAYLKKSSTDPELDHLNKIIDAALELEPPDRKEFVHRSCGGNKELQERVFELINRCINPPPPDFLQPPAGIRDVARQVYSKFLKEGL